MQEFFEKKFYRMWEYKQNIEKVQKGLENMQITHKKHKTTTRSLLIISCFLFRLAKSRPMGGCSLDTHCGGCIHFQFAPVVL